MVTACPFLYATFMQQQDKGQELLNNPKKGSSQGMYSSVQLLHAAMGSMAFCTLEGGNCTRGERVPFVLLYLCNIIIPLLEVPLSSSNIITTDYSLFNKQKNKKLFPRTRGCFVHSAKSTNAGNDQDDVHRCTSLFMLPGPSSHVTCVFVARHVIGSRPIKLHNLYTEYNNSH